MQPKDRILDVYGSFGRTSGGWIAIGDLIKLLECVDLDAQAVRSAASRMKRKGLLLAQKRDGVAGYALSESATEILADGHERIFRSVEPTQDQPWVVALFSVPEAERRKRYLIRSRLERLGFGQGPASSWFAPAAVLPETLRMLERTGLGVYVTIWQGGYVGSADFDQLVARSWDLAAIRGSYDEYLTRFRPVADAWGEQELDDSGAFALYVRQIAHWRTLPYLDPGLPPHVLPLDWPGAEARALFLQLEGLLQAQAGRFFATNTSR